ncbi:MAG TPA: peptidase M16 [Cyanobacteria bacterium UBA11370]|nr:peptidase M16 [Cyanobacteria bacterium UBA11370]HBY79062.1 peptidase M16 [Cyanobacteria bacterium UBA11148]
MPQNVTAPEQQQIIHRTVLDNGIVVIAIENSAADIIATRLFIRAGSQWESREKAGLSHLLSAVLTKGTQKLSSIEIAERVESVGAQLSADTATDYFLLSLKTVSTDWPEMLELAGQMLRYPSFPETEVELERHLTIQDIRSQKEQPFNIAFEQLRQAMYQDHPYGLSILGTEAAIAKLLRSDLEDYHQTYFRPDNLVISVAGRVTPAEAIEQITSVFWDWQAPQTPVNQPVLPLIKSQPSRVITPQETQQSIVMLGYLASAVKDPNYAALKLLNTYLGNGLSSRLFVELREKRGLAYDVSAFYPTRQSASTFVVYMGTAPENTTIALEGLRAEVERLCTSSLSIDELQTSTNKLLGQYALGKQTNAQLAQIYGWYETLGLGIEFDTQFQEDVTNVTPEIAQAVANQYFSEPYISLVGPNEAINF